MTEFDPERPVNDVVSDVRCSAVAAIQDLRVC